MERSSTIVVATINDDDEWGPGGVNLAALNAIPVDPGPFTAEELVELDRLRRETPQCQDQ